MGQQYNPQSNPSNPQTGQQKMPGQQDDKHRHSQAKEQQPNRTDRNPGSKKPQREQDE
jgi:hypothetical protein